MYVSTSMEVIINKHIDNHIVKILTYKKKLQRASQAFVTKSVFLIITEKIGTLINYMS
jgi:hypothetical protein